MARAGLAALCLAAAVLWSVPILAAGLIALLRYGFGSLFVVGESLAAALVHSTGADIAGTVQRLQLHPWQGAAQSALGVALSLGAGALAADWVRAAMLLATAAALWAVAANCAAAAGLLVAGLVCGAVALRTRRP